MTLNNHKKKCLYEMLSLITWKKHRTIQVYFQRNGLDILSPIHFFEYAKWNYNPNSRDEGERR